MDNGLSVLEKHACNGHSNGDGGVLPVTFRELQISKDFLQCVGIFWEAWKVVNRVDLSGFGEYKFFGKTDTMSDAEALLYHYLSMGHRIHLAFDGEAVCGIMVWLPVFEGVAAVRMLYFPEQYRERGLGVGLVKSVPEIRTVLFQTQKHIEPTRFLKAIAGRPRKMFEGDTLITWEMEMGE